MTQSIVNQPLTLMGHPDNHPLKNFSLMQEITPIVTGPLSLSDIGQFRCVCKCWKAVMEIETVYRKVFDQLFPRYSVMKLCNAQRQYEAVLSSRATEEAWVNILGRSPMIDFSSSGISFSQLIQENADRAPEDEK